MGQGVSGHVPVVCTQVRMPSGDGQHWSDSPGMQSLSAKQGPVGTPVTHEFVFVVSTPFA